MEPDTSDAPVTPNRTRGHLNHFGYLFEGHTTEEMQFDNFALPRIKFPEFADGVVKGEKLIGAIGSKLYFFSERHLNVGSPPFFSLLFAGMIHQDVAHHGGSQG